MKDDINVKISVKNDLDDLKSYIRDLKKAINNISTVSIHIGLHAVKINEEDDINAKKIIQKHVDSIDSDLEEIEKKVNELEEKAAYLDDITKDVLIKNKKLAVVKGICPFPESCNNRSFCEKDFCNADVCSNGYAYRMS